MSDYIAFAGTRTWKFCNTREEAEQWLREVGIGGHVYVNREDQQEQIERLQAAVKFFAKHYDGPPDNMLTSRERELFQVPELLDAELNGKQLQRLQNERDEAREAARWLYEAWSADPDEPVPPEPYLGPVEVRWPWLEDDKEAGSE